MTRTDNVTGIRAGGGASAARQQGAGIDPALYEATLARSEGRYDDALRHVQAAFARAVADGSGRRTSDFGPMFEWTLLAACHAPAREELVRARDVQAHRLLAGELTYGTGTAEWPCPRSRFALIVHMNNGLGDARATHELFAQVDRTMPETARRESFLALPAVVEAGDFVLGERYLPDPLGSLDRLNETSRSWALFPLTRSAPRLAAELSNFAQDVRLRSAILRGLGREAESRTLLDAAVAGLATDEMRDWLRQDLATPGAILRASADHRMAQDEAAAEHIPKT